MRYLARVLVWSALAVLVCPPAYPCSTFCFRSGQKVLLGKNYDWNVPDGLLFVNKRKVGKTAAATGPGPQARWVSRYGSVTFNQYGREFPNGGINEAGLVVELMWLEGSRYPASDSRGALSCLQWIQYQLDTAAAVSEVLASDAAVRIEATTPLHYMVADREGRVAAVEFLDGRLVAHTGRDLPVPALTNSTYDASIRYLRQLRGDRLAVPPGNGSLVRFARLAGRADRFPRQAAGDRVAYAFETLSAVSQEAATQWSIVYELDARRVSFRTSRNPAIRTLNLAGLDFDCDEPVLVADLHEGPAGDLSSRLRPYEAEINLELVRGSFRKTSFLAETPDAALRRRAHYPASTTCGK